MGFGAGNLDLADWTRASSFCILAVSDRICDSDVEGAIPFAGVRVGGGLGAVDRTDGVERCVVVVFARVGGRDDAVDESLGRGVVLVSIDGSLDLCGFFVGGIGVLIGGTLVLGSGGGADASDMGGDGGSFTCVFAEDTDEAGSGGVVTMGELAMDIALTSNIGLSGTERSVSVADMWRSCFLSLSCRTSASILRSDSSSRRRCVSILNCSLSCSPILISSSIMTALSIAPLYLFSRSSREELVWRACRSKSSFATSISRSLCCSVRFESRRVVISFSRVFWAALVSVFDSLCFLYKTCWSATKLRNTVQMGISKAHLPFIDFVFEAFCLVPQRILSLLRSLQVLLQLLFEFLTGDPELGELCLKLLVL